MQWAYELKKTCDISAFARSKIRSYGQNNYHNACANNLQTEPLVDNYAQLRPTLENPSDEGINFG